MPADPNAPPPINARDASAIGDTSGQVQAVAAPAVQKTTATGILAPTVAPKPSTKTGLGAAGTAASSPAAQNTNTQLFSDTSAAQAGLANPGQTDAVQPAQTYNAATDIEANKSNQETNGPGAGVQGQNVGTGFNNMQNILQANLPGAKTMAAKALNDYSNLAPGASPGSVDEAGGSYKDSDGNQQSLTQDQVDAQRGAYGTALKSFSGINGILNNEYSDSSYSSGQSGLDSFLIGATGGGLLNNAADLYKNQLKNVNAPIVAPAGGGTPSAPKPPPVSTANIPIVSTQTVQNTPELESKGIANLTTNDRVDNYQTLQNVLNNAAANPHSAAAQAAVTSVEADMTPAQIAQAKAAKPRAAADAAGQLPSEILTSDQEAINRPAVLAGTNALPAVSPYQPAASVAKPVATTSAKSKTTTSNAKTTSR